MLWGSVDILPLISFSLLFIDVGSVVFMSRRHIRGEARLFLVVNTPLACPSK